MKQCDSVEMRKNLKVVETLKMQGIDFVAIPVGGALTKEKLIKLMAEQLDVLIEESGLTLQ